MSMQFDHDEMSEINMTPLVDVMLVLLIVFMITMPVLTHSVDVDLPKARTQASTAQAEAITLSVTATGALRWNNEAVELETLKARLQDQAELPEPPQVRIQGDKQVPYDKVMTVMAAVQQAGLTKVGFVTQPAD